MSFPRYPAYKDSGVAYWRMIPIHWDLMPLKRISPSLTVGIVVNPSTYVSADGLPFIYGGDISEGKVHHGTARRISDEASNANGKTRLSAGDLLTVRVGAPGITAVVPPECEGGNCASVMLIRKGRFSSDWLCFAMNSRQLRHQVEVVQYGAAQEQFNINHAVDFLVAQPSMAEQEAIAAFLNAETTKIDALVAEQEQLITLLKEKRQAFISHAVTKGLDPSVPMKDSGVEWLGEAPAHWVVTKLGRFARLRGGFAFSADDFGDEGIQIVRMNNLKRGVLDLSSSVRVPNEKFVESVNLNVGDLVWGMSGSIGETGSLGNFARIREENLPCLLNQRVGRFDAEPSGLSLDFLEQLIQTQYFYEQIIVLVTGTAQFNISSDQVQSCIVALPPVEEQVLIVAHLAEQATSFDELIFTAQQSIDFLSERRSALISAAVTGQIDIRGECNVFKS